MSTIETKAVENPLDYRMTGNGQAYDIAEYGDGQFESGFFGAGQRAWHGLGTVIPEDVVTADRALELAGLDWQVVPQPMYLPDGVEVEKFVANVRQTDSKQLGVVGKGYEIVQNEEAFGFIDDLLDDSGAKFHTAGSLKGGEKVWILAKLPNVIRLGEGEEIDPFLLFSNDHTGNAAIVVGPTPVRVVCRNTLRIAQAGMQNQWKARHTSNVATRILEARRTLQLSFQYYEDFENLAKDMISTKITSAQFGKFLESLIPYKADFDPAAPVATDRAAMNVEEARAAIRGLYEHADTCANIRGTAWGAYNAVAEYADFDRPIRGKKNQVERAWVRAIEDGTGLKHKAQVLATALMA